jgi:hypothetical protein
MYERSWSWVEVASSDDELGRVVEPTRRTSRVGVESMDVNRMAL